MKVCSVDGCEVEQVAKGFCDKHYRRWKKHGSPLVGEVKPVTATCCVKGCTEKHKARGYCIKHYSKFLKYGDPLIFKAKEPITVCSVSDCEENHYAKGFCRLHYGHYKSTGDPLLTKIRNRYQTCTVDGCNNKYFSKGYCRRHYNSLRNRGQCTIDGCEKKLHSKKYCQMHYGRFWRLGDPNKVNAIFNSICKIEGCSENSRVNGFCTKHYMKSDLAAKRYRIAAAKRRSAKLNAPINDFSKSDWDECLAHFNNSCAYCGKPSKKLQVEHVTPLSKNGSHTKTNIVPACKSCNRDKFTKTLDEWYPFQNFYSKDREIKMHQWLGYEIKGNAIQIAMF